MSVLLLILAAFAVDLGNAYAHKRERQKDADHSTLAGTGVGGANLPAPTSAATCSYGKAAVAGDQAVKDVAAYLTKQLGSTVTPGSLVDCQVEQNGEVFYGKPSKTSTGWSLAYDQYKLSLVSPPDTVEFGMANIMGVDSVNVRGQATAAIGTPQRGQGPSRLSPLTVAIGANAPCTRRQEPRPVLLLRPVLRGSDR